MSFCIKHLSCAVILGYYKGNQFLEPQLRSILRQTHTNIDIFIGDDMSPQRAEDVIHLLPLKNQRRITLLRQSKNQGFCQNFLTTLAKVPADYDFYAFSDQDDVWQENKISRALTFLKNYPDSTPLLYGSRTEIVDQFCKKRLGFSPVFSRPPSFSNALVQSLAGGNTMVLNRVARNLVVAASKDTSVVSHDWWCYQIITGAGGTVLYDRKPSLQYRQHAQNIVGANGDWKARYGRILKVLRGTFRRWNEINGQALQKNIHYLTPNNQKKLAYFLQARKAKLGQRLWLLHKAGVYRQTLGGNIALIVAAILRKI